MKTLPGLVAVLAAAACLADPARTGARAADPAVADLTARGVPLPAAERIAGALATCATEGLPIAPLRTRLQEGIAKNAAPDALASAIEARLAALRTARALVGSAGYAEPAEPAHGELLVSTARAIESGMPASDLGDVLARGRGQSGGRMQTIVESGESLALAGVDAPTVRAFMIDCLDRNLRRMEMLRAARFSIQQHRGGMNGTDIRRTLWGDGASQALPLRGQGAGAGSGRGGPGGGPMGPPGTSTPSHRTPSAGGGAAGAGSPGGGTSGGGGTQAPGGASAGPGSPGGNASAPGGPGGATR